MNVIFTCGGTAGHISPAVAVADLWKERYPESNILFVGGEGNMEEELVPKAGYRLVTLPASGMARGKSLKALSHNIKTISQLIQSVSACKKIIREFCADVIVGTGGYASFPALMAGSLMGIPICVHEANAMPGLTTRLIANRADRVLTCFEESVGYYRHPEKVEVVGMPVKREFIFTKKEEARASMGLDERPVIVSAFGSQGAKAMNEVVADLFCIEKEAGFPYQHLHAVGSYGWDWMPALVRQKGIQTQNNKDIIIEKYFYNMPEVMAAADVIISRAGASSCNEIAASGTPCILIPSPNVTDNHQEKNARSLADQGAAVLMLEKDCTAEALYAQIQTLLGDKEQYNQMRRKLQSLVVVDSTQRLCDIIADLAKRKS